MRAPHSYTGENVLEFQVHGGHVPAGAVLRVVLERGALSALPGEFTFRAFANGRIDLTQAESVADIISAGTGLSARVALQNSGGMLRSELDELRDSLLALRARLEASIDFVDDDIPAVEAPVVLRELEKVQRKVDRLLQTYDIGRVVRVGAHVVISGPPNVGKSSLFNALMRYDRAIVTDIPGTTRDALTETIDINGLPVILADTAGIRDASDAVEMEGVRRALDRMASADLVINVCCADVPYSMQPVSDGRQTGIQIVRVVNKVDLMSAPSLADESRRQPEAVMVSAVSGFGLPQLRERIYQALIGDSWNEDTTTVTRERHQEGLLRCRKALARAAGFIGDGTPLEVTAIELRAACEALEELTGKICDEDVLTRIFGEFCIGK
jgi:tRNA modification GTPase